jgi:hypothetical protein
VRLLKLKVSGYRRFEQQTSIILEHHINAVVGRNEAGKSSLLDAMVDLNTRNQLPRKRRTRDSAEALEIAAHFSLDHADLEALSALPSAGGVRWLEVIRTEGGRTYVLDPVPQRDRASLRSAAEALEAISDDPALDSDYASEDHPWVDSVIVQLRSEDEAPDTTEWTALANSLDNIQYPAQAPTEEGIPDEPEQRARSARAQQRGDAAGLLWAAIQTEEEEDPAEAAIRLLSNRVPPFLRFTDEDRDLRAEYSLLEETEGPEGEAQLIPGPVPLALQNLAQLAKLELPALCTEIAEPNPAEAQTRVNRANAELRRRLTEDWGQSPIECELKIDGTALQIFVKGEGSDALFEISDRSAGLRNFIALQAFVSDRTDPPPILLMDEIETHLHYDAQVDLIDTLAAQTSASQVVYTTHSIGCLPPDLITGISAVVPVTDSNRSRIDGGIWGNGPSLGLEPLLLGMGADVPRVWWSR